MLLNAAGVGGFANERLRWFLSRGNGADVDDADVSFGSFDGSLLLAYSMSGEE